MLAGMLTDGSWFQGVDRLTIVGPSQNANLSVRSNIRNTWIEVSPLDNVKDDHGWTNYSRDFTPGTNVTITAPATRLNNQFKHWEVNGVVMNKGVNTLNITVGAQMDVKAVYKRVRSVWGGLGLSK